MFALDDEIRRFGRLLHYAGVLAAVLCVAAGFSLVHAPTVDAIADTSSRIEELKLSIQNASIMRDQHRKVTDQLSEVTARIAGVQRRVPRDADAGEFLKEVTQLASEEQLVIKDFTPEKPEHRNGYAEMQVTLKGSGSYASICKFVDRLSKLKRLSKVKDLTLSAEGNANEYPMTATLVIYFGLRGKEADSTRSPQENHRG
ncbi:MAG: type 4a pilus biogenesis protein PilO [Planctomycetes bacterium]|nr:type 4a pilus biogenesis protein PilO [Planctomycetota bacterium]